MSYFKKIALMLVVLVAVLGLVAVSQAQDGAPAAAGVAATQDDPLAIDEDNPLAGGDMASATETAAQPSEADELFEPPASDAPAAVSAAVRTAFSFNSGAQIRLNNQVVNATCDVNFTLYNAASGGTLIAGPVAKVIAIQGGRFTTSLDFGNTMNGEERWVELALRCPAGSGSFTTIAPRRVLSAVPYALGLLPGTTIVGNYNGTILGVTNFSTGYLDRAIVGTTFSSDGGSGVIGGGASTTGRSFGVAGYTNNAGGYGGYFYNNAPGGAAVYARSGHEYVADIILGANGAADDGLITSDYGQPWSDIVLSGRDKVMVVIGANRQNNGDSYFDVRHPSRGAILRVYPDGRTVTKVLQITGGSDLSEQFDVQAHDRLQPEPGLVVCIDAANPGELVVCSEAYSTVVAGVISGAGGVQPGMLMGQDGTAADGEHPVALTGRVYVWADASQGAIQPGDLLTTAAAPGHAMRAADRDRAQGAILGKAMTALEEGTGLVLVLVSLQ